MSISYINTPTTPLSQPSYALKPPGQSASNKKGLYTAAGFMGAGALIPATMLGKKIKDEFRQNGRKLAPAVGHMLLENFWLSLGTLALGSAAARLVSKDSLNSPMSLGERAKALGQGVGATTLATIPELGAGALVVMLAVAAKKIRQAKGGNYISALGNALKNKPLWGFAFAGLAAISLWLEIKSSKLSDKAFSGK